MCVDFNEGVLELPVIQGHSITGQYHSSSSYCRAVTIDARRGMRMKKICITKEMSEK
jgi:hypothetical protein